MNVDFLYISQMWVPWVPWQALGRWPPCSIILEHANSDARK